MTRWVAVLLTTLVVLAGPLVQVWGNDASAAVAELVNDGGPEQVDAESDAVIPALLFLNPNDVGAKIPEQPGPGHRDASLQEPIDPPKR